MKTRGGEEVRTRGGEDKRRLRGEDEEVKFNFWVNYPFKIRLKTFLSDKAYSSGSGPEPSFHHALSLTFMICCSVLLQAPSLVIANAVEMLMGDMKMLDSGVLPRASCLYSDRAKRLLAFDSSHTRGFVDSGTGSGSVVGPSGSGLR